MLVIGLYQAQRGQQRFRDKNNAVKLLNSGLMECSTARQS